MNPSSSSIDQALGALKAKTGTFQRLAEDYADLTYPHLFHQLTPRGRRADDVTVRGWPDAYSQLPDGRLAVVEATHSEAWRKHLDLDVAKAEALGKGVIGAFLFVAWAKAPAQRNLDLYRNRLIALGIPGSNIFFIFREQLTRAIAQPKFARLWVDDLGISTSAFPFSLIDDAHHLFGSDDHVEAFAPSRAEFVAGEVHRPSLADIIEHRLARDKWVLVRGHGAAGKTVLAMAIAFGPDYRSRPVYYLDLTDWQGNIEVQAKALEAMATRGDSGVLFVVDNIHLDPRSAREIFDGWRFISTNGSRLLLLGRYVTFRPDHRGRTHPFHDLEPETLDLRVENRDLAGIYRRLLRRHAGNRSITQPPDLVLENWSRIFSGDLIAFSAAIARRIRELALGDWELMAGEARLHIEEEYLRPLSPQDHEIIVKLAVLAGWELTASLPSLGISQLSFSFLAKGLVVCIQSATGPRLRLVHPGMGDLILAALPNVDRLLVLQQIAVHDPAVGVSVARHFNLEGKQQNSKLILQNILEALQQSIPATVNAIDYIPRLARLADNLGVIHVGQLDQLLLRYGTDLTEAALSGQLDAFRVFLQYTKPNLPLTFHSVCTESLSVKYRRRLGQLVVGSPFYVVTLLFEFAKNAHQPLYAELRTIIEGNTAELSNVAIRSPLQQVAFFLKSVRNSLPQSFKEMHARIAAKGHRQALADNAAQTPLHCLPPFLEFARRNLPTVYIFLCQDLSEPSRRSALIDLIPRQPLENLIAFLNFTSSSPELVEVLDDFKLFLDCPENDETILNLALPGSLGALSSLLEFLRCHLPASYQRLVSALSEQENRRLIAGKVIQAPLTQLISFLKDDTLGASVVQEIKADELKHGRDANVPLEVSALSTVVLALARHGRIDLAASLANTAISRPDLPQWQKEQVQLTTLSFVLRFRRDLDSATVDQFLERIATEDWLMLRYRKLDAGPMAGALFSLWAALEERQLARFKTPVLLHEIRKKLGSSPVQDAQELANLISLIGVSALLGLHLPPRMLFSIEGSGLIEAISVRTPDELEKLLPLQVHLWLGVREIAQRSDRVIKVNLDVGKLMLKLWREATSENTKLQALNRDMVAWLERCSAAQWILISEATISEDWMRKA